MARTFSEDSFTFHGEINGSGVGARIFRVIHKTTGIQYALKCPREGFSLALEAAIYSYVSHPNIVKMEGLVCSPKKTSILMELCDEDLHTKSEREKVDVLKCIREMTDVLDYLDSRDIVYGDVKLENILILGDVFKLADFGQSCFRSRPIYKAHGTRGYRAPEVSLCNNVSLKSDLWSLGVLTFVLITNYLPFDELCYRKKHSIDSEEIGTGKVKEVYDMIELKLRIDKFLKDPVEKDFISRLIVVNPNKRMTIAEIKNHPFLSKNP